MNQRRVAKGVPIAGQFAVGAKGESGVALGSSAEEASTLLAQTRAAVARKDDPMDEYRAVAVEQYVAVLRDPSLLESSDDTYELLATIDEAAQEQEQMSLDDVTASPMADLDDAQRDKAIEYFGTLVELTNGTPEMDAQRGGALVVLGHLSAAGVEGASATENARLLTAHANRNNNALAALENMIDDMRNR